MSSTDTGAPPEDQVDADGADEVRRRILDTLTSHLGDAVVGSHIEKGDIWVRVDAAAWRRAVEVCRDALGCDYFCFLSGLDWMPSSAPNPEDAVADDDPLAAGDDDGDDDGAAATTGSAPTEPEEVAAVTPGPGDGWETGYAGGSTRFQVFSRLYSTRGRYGVTLKADLDDEHPAVESITPLYRGAEWHEREAWEMYGFEFRGHPDVRHLFLPSQFEGHPLRKDFPLLAREVKPWPGLVDVEPMPAEEADGGAGEEG